MASPEKYPGPEIPSVEESARLEQYLTEFKESKNRFIINLNDANDPSFGKRRRLKTLSESFSDHIEKERYSRGIEGGVKSLYLFYDTVVAQFERNVFLRSEKNQKLSFDDLPLDQQAYLISLAGWQQDFADFYAAYSGFQVYTNLHDEMNKAIDDLIADAPMMIDEMYGVELSADEVKQIAGTLVQGSKASAAGIDLLRQITVGWKFKWGEEMDDIKRKIDAIAYKDEDTICTIQLKGPKKGKNRIITAEEYRRSSSSTTEPDALIASTRSDFAGAIPIYVFVGYNLQNINMKTATVLPNLISEAIQQLNSIFGAES